MSHVLYTGLDLYVANVGLELASAPLFLSARISDVLYHASILFVFLTFLYKNSTHALFSPVKNCGNRAGEH